MSLHDVIRHLVEFGPARNESERADLLAQVDADEQPAQPVSQSQPDPQPEEVQQ